MKIQLNNSKTSEKIKECNLSNIIALTSVASGLLAGAIALAYYWPTAYPLFGATALVGSVSFGLIPAIKNELIKYKNCRGPSKECSISSSINTLGQAASILSVISFGVAATLQVTALAFLATWILAPIGLTIEVAVGALVASGIASCLATIGIFAGVVTNAYSYKNCMDKQEKEPINTTDKPINDYTEPIM